MKRERFTYIGGGSNKEYTVVLDDSQPGRYIVRGESGRIGSTMAVQPKYDGSSLSQAMSAYSAEIQKRHSKGYQPAELKKPLVSTVPAPESGAIKTGAAPFFNMKPPESDFIWPQLLSEVDQAGLEERLDSPLWVAQLKKDGVRIELVRKGTSVYGYTKLGKKRMELPEDVVTAALRMNWERFHLDGELVGDLYWAFDVLAADGKSVRELPYIKRYELLEGWAASEFQGDGIAVVDTAYNRGEKRALYAAAKEANAEGLVLKKHAAPYTSGRGPDQVKFKFWTTASVIVAGPSAGGKRSVDMKLFDGAPLGSVTIKANQSVPAAGSVIEVAYLYWVSSMVQPEFLGIREDTLPEECAVGQLKKKQGEEQIHGPVLSSSPRPARSADALR